MRAFIDKLDGLAADLNRAAEKGYLEKTSGEQTIRAILAVADRLEKIAETLESVKAIAEYESAMNNALFEPPNLQSERE